jgi:hypothetical protein
MTTPRTFPVNTDTMLRCAARTQEAAYGGVVLSQKKDTQLAMESATFRSSAEQVRWRTHPTKLFLTALKDYWIHRGDSYKTNENKVTLLERARKVYDASWPSTITDSVLMGTADAYSTYFSTAYDSIKNLTTWHDHSKYKMEDSREAHLYGILLLVALTLPTESIALIDYMTNVKAKMLSSDINALQTVLDTTRNTNTIDNFEAPFPIMPRNPIFSDEVAELSEHDFPSIVYCPFSSSDRTKLSILQRN